MIRLFSEAGLAALGTFVTAGTLYAFDLDGTLAPIVADPARIAIPKTLRERLEFLGQLAPVAVITGRSVADARRHLGFDPRYLVGNHGAEGLPGPERREDFQRQCRAWREQLATLLPHAAEQGIVIEDKGATLSLHYRNAPDRATALESVMAAIDGLEPVPRRVSGKCVENVVPRDAPHKGEALLLVMRHAGCARTLFVGDDTTDEDVFRLRDDRILGIRVGCEAESLAGCCLSDQRDVSGLLYEIIQLTIMSRLS